MGGVPSKVYAGIHIFQFTLLLIFWIYVVTFFVGKGGGGTGSFEQTQRP